MKRQAVLLSLLLATAACGREPQSPVTEGDPQTDSPEGEAKSGPESELPEGEGAWSNAGGFYAVWSPLVETVPFNEEFDLRVWLFEDETRDRPIPDAQVVIDCRMPHHQHGMLHDVDLVPAGDGSYLAEGMLCHMMGYWELHLDVTRGPVTERAQFALEVE